MSWFSDLFTATPKPFDPSTLTVIVFGSDAQSFSAEAQAALGKKAVVTAVDGPSGVKRFLTAHGQTGTTPRCELVFAHQIPVKGGGPAPESKVEFWLQNWSPGRAFPDGDKGRPSVQVTRLAGTNRVFIRTTWETGVSVDILLRIAEHQQKWYDEISSHWLTH